MNPTEFRPGMYEGISAEQAEAQVGTNAMSKHDALAQNIMDERQSTPRYAGTPRPDKPKWNEKDELNDPTPPEVFSSAG